jgi:hypothetical protein
LGGIKVANELRRRRCDYATFTNTCSSINYEELLRITKEFREKAKEVDDGLRKAFAECGESRINLAAMMGISIDELDEVLNSDGPIPWWLWDRVQVFKRISRSKFDSLDERPICHTTS